jgi:two-component system response regulator NreC
MPYKSGFSSQSWATTDGACYADVAVNGTPIFARQRILIVDDHPIVLFGLRVAFEQHGRYVICGEAGDPEHARALTGQSQPDFIVLDLVLGGRDGIELVRDLAAIAPAARILVYSSQSEWRFARRVLQVGARGFVAKSDGLETVTAAIDVLARGDVFVGEWLRHRLLEDFIEAAPCDLREAINALSERERQVLYMIGEGRAVGEIAAVLDVSVKTVGTYRDRIKAKLGIANSRDLTIVAHDHL